MSSSELKQKLVELGREGARMQTQLQYYWEDEGVHQLETFIDPDLYQFIEKMYQESRALAERVAELETLANELD